MENIKKAQSGAMLKVDNLKDREILHYNYTYTRNVDSKLKPTGEPAGGKILLKVKALSDGNAELFAWLLNNLAKKNGKIEVMIPGESKKMKDIEFEDAYCVSYQEIWDIGLPSSKEGTISYPHQEHITLACRKITNGATHENEWDKEKESGEK